MAMMAQNDERSEISMQDYRFPYLNSHQSRTQEPTAWQQELADALENVFSKGARELDEVVAGLNGTRVRPPDGSEWTSSNFTKIMRELGD